MKPIFYLIWIRTSRQFFEKDQYYWVMYFGIFPIKKNAAFLNRTLTFLKINISFSLSFSIISCIIMDCDVITSKFSDGSQRQRILLIASLFHQIEKKALKTNYWENWKLMIFTICRHYSRTLELKCSLSIRYWFSVYKWTESHRFFSASNCTVMQILSSTVWNAPIIKRLSVVVELQEELKHILCKQYFTFLKSQM